MLVTIIVLISFLTVFTLVYVKTSPQFGGNPTEESIQKMSVSKQFKNGAFENAIPTKQSTGFEWSSIPKFFTNGENKVPTTLLPQQELTKKMFEIKDSLPRVTWFGHSAIFLELENKNIFIDPMLGDVPAPHPLLGGSRFNKDLPLNIESLPDIDLVLISHDHYDHLDYGTIQQIKDKVNQFYVPLGIKAHLTKWGVEAHKIKEFDWWESAIFAEIEVTAAPARHFSGRAFKRNNTLWSSWIIKSKNHSIFFSGDSGYAPHFKEIGEKYGPFDFAMMECGQYNHQWAHIHMTPEETIIASKDVKANLVMPIHWGAFKLALHSWDDPIVRATKKAEELNIKLASPILGESFLIDSNNYPSNKWWKQVPKSE